MLTDAIRSSGRRTRDFVLDRLEGSSVVHVVEQVEVARAQRPTDGCSRRPGAAGATSRLLTRRPPAASP